MEKVKQWVTDLLEQSPFAKTFQWRIAEGSGEGYELSIFKGKLVVKAESYLAAAYALHTLKVACQAGHLNDYFGKRNPKFPLRPVWLPSRTIHIGNIDKLCQKSISLGFNAWIVGRFFEGMFSQETVPSYPVAEWSQNLQAYGLKLFLKPLFQRTFGPATVCPLNTAYQSDLKELFEKMRLEIGECEGIFWESPHLESGFENDPAAQDFLHSDLVLTDLKMMEERLGPKKTLIYYLPALQPKDATAAASWMISVCAAAGPKTKIAFPAVAGTPFKDHLPPHPFWEKLRKTPECSATPLLPIINGGGISQGEGLWPGIAADLFQQFIPRCQKAPFEGIIIPTKTLPDPGTFLEGSLWIGAQAQWERSAPELIAETWQAAYYPLDFKEVFTLIRHIIKEISYLGSIIPISGRHFAPHDGKTRLERTHASLKYLETLALPLISRLPNSKFANYYPFFAKDSKRIISQFALHLGVPTPHLVPQGDLEECFWSDMTYPPHYSRRTHPRKGQLASKMEAIFLENGFET